jgi:ankyrin repeat protein
MSIPGTSLGRTPLYFAISLERLEITTELISSRANINAENPNGMTPLRLALRLKNQDLIHLLLKESVDLKDIMAEEWRNAYGNEARDIVHLSEGSNGDKMARVLAESEIPEAVAQMSTQTETERRLLCVP